MLNIKSRILHVGVLVGASAMLSMGLTNPAQATPGQWNQVSLISGGSSFPVIANFTRGDMARFGDQLQVVWRQSAAARDTQFWSAVLDRNGQVTRQPFPIITGWSALTADASILDWQGQRMLSFSGLPDGLGGAQRFALSGDGVNWAVDPGSLSASRVAYLANGGSTVDAGGTVIWAGTPGNNPGLTWHVGVSGSNPAPEGSDGVFGGLGCCSSDAQAAFDASTGATWGAFYSNNNSAPGVYVGQISPSASEFRLAPGVKTGAQDVALAARAQGGVYLAYITPEFSFRGTIRVWNVGTGQTWDLPNTENADNVSLSAAPDGRLYVVWETSGDVRSVASNRAGTDFGAQGSFNSPRKGSTVYSTRVLGGEGVADVLVNTRVNNVHNIWHGQVQPTLSIDVVGRARQGGNVKLVIRDAGVPVRLARVNVAGRNLRTASDGTVTFKAPRRSGVKVVAKSPGFRDGQATIRLKR